MPERLLFMLIVFVSIRSSDYRLQDAQASTPLVLVPMCFVTDYLDYTHACYVYFEKVHFSNGKGTCEFWEHSRL